VVTAKRSDWQRDPYTLTEENGFFYGRGTLDIKQEVAILTETFLRLKREHFVPTRDLIIVFSGDEETAEDTIADLVQNKRELVDAEFALNGDGGGGVLDPETGKPKLFYVQGAEKTSAAFLLTTRNPGGHSSQPRADNAIYELAGALQALSRYTFRTQTNEWTLGDFKATSALTPGPLGEAMAHFVANPQDAAATAALAQYPAQVGKLRTTCVATMLTGGHAENALPQSASATVNCRIFPGMSGKEVHDTLQAVVGPNVVVTHVYEPVFSDASPLRPDVMAAIGKAVNAANPGAVLVPTMAPYATDGAVFRNGGIPTYGVGSTFIKESDEFAHGLNERIPVKSFYSGLTHWYVLIQSLAGHP
jgi:acetylornithine deacetylase/succinyl-diaminopimelate desuccinylase-like protein